MPGRKSSKQNVIYGANRYCLDKRRNERSYWKCVNRGCYSRITIHGGRVLNASQHTPPHPPTAPRLPPNATRLMWWREEKRGAKSGEEGSANLWCGLFFVGFEWFVLCLECHYLCSLVVCILFGLFCFAYEKIILNIANWKYNWCGFELSYDYLRVSPINIIICSSLICFLDWEKELCWIAIRHYLVWIFMLSQKYFNQVIILILTFFE